MAASEVLDLRLRLAARRAYELGRFQGAVLRGAAAALVAAPGLMTCNHSPWAAVCLTGFALVVAAGRMRGGLFEQGARAGAIAGILPCLLPAAISSFDPELCMRLFANGLWLCGVGGAAAGVILGLRGRDADGIRFWAPAIAAFGFAGALGCLPAGAVGFAGLALGLAVGAAPVLVWRKAIS